MNLLNYNNGESCEFECFTSHFILFFLQQNLKTFMDNATNGVIYVSFGSFCPTVNLDRNIRDALITALSNVKQQVLLKWENDTFTEKPENIKVSSWFPQPSILGMVYFF